jgi:hypothetical protein
MRTIEHFSKTDQKENFGIEYLRYRTRNPKHGLWLMNRKRPNKVVYDDDARILSKCKEGTIAIYNSCGYYLKDIFPAIDIDVIESSELVKTFYKDCHIASREELHNIGKRYDNFVVTNFRGDLWTTVEGLETHFAKYKALMNNGCYFFYSFRDTQMLGINRLKTDMEKYFYDWALSLRDKLNFELLSHTIAFPKKSRKADGTFDLNENPDTVNGNIKFLFQNMDQA